jgi:hypothetical protein
VNGTIKAIETRYKGYRMQSRLEARWAVFFDALGIEWEYEKEGFDLGEEGWYLPDFYLKDFAAWIEIKPQHAPDIAAVNKCLALSRQMSNLVMLIVGNPFPDEHQVLVLIAGSPFVSAQFAETYEPDRGGYALAISDDKRRCFLQTCTAPDLAQAFASARSARFEHGESGGAQ